MRSYCSRPLSRSLAAARGRSEVSWLRLPQDDDAKCRPRGVVRPPSRDEMKSEVAVGSKRRQCSCAQTLIGLTGVLPVPDYRSSDA